MVKTEIVNSNVLVRENYLNNSREICYLKQKDDSQVKCVVHESDAFSFNILARVRLLLYEVFLPRGYPSSVSDDYTWYQIWDTCQACCSTFTGMLSVQAVLTGVGVGREAATPLAAAVTWFIKDGVGMLSGIAFAWLKGTSLDSECKKWRLFADVVNDLAFCIELSIAVLQDYALYLLCFSSALKAIVGVAGGATRAALTHHQACNGNTADVAAKDGSQETLVNLLAMSTGIWMINTGLVQQNIWLVMSLLVSLHLFCNFKAVKSLRLSKFNEERLLIVLKKYIVTGSITSVHDVNMEESVFLGFGANSEKLFGVSITVGKSLKGKLPTSDEFQKILSNFEKEKYVIVPESSSKSGFKVHVALKSDAKDCDVLKAYFHSILYFLNFVIKTTPNDSKQMNRLKMGSGNFNQIVQEEFEDFTRKCKLVGWATDQHVLKVDQWRVSVNTGIKKYN